MSFKLKQSSYAWRINSGCDIIIIIWAFSTPGKILKIAISGREVWCISEVKHERWGTAVFGGKKLQWINKINSLLLCSIQWCSSWLHTEFYSLPQWFNYHKDPGLKKFEQSSFLFLTASRPIIQWRTWLTFLLRKTILLVYQSIFVLRTTYEGFPHNTVFQ